MPLERAVQFMTDDPARLFGLRARGRLAVGYHADLVVFDPDTVDATRAEVTFDLPGASKRLISHPLGVSRVYVNGVQTFANGEPTGATPGVVLRSGRDTETVLTS